MAPKRSKPVIAVTGPDRGGLPAWVCTAWQVRRAGGQAVRITPKRKKRAPHFNGLVIGGGIDIDPRWYNHNQPIPPLIPRMEKKDRSWRGIPVYLLRAIFFPLIFLLRKLFRTGRPLLKDPDRDRMEFSLLEHALQHDLPVLGICRGAQLINVFCKGTLYTDISGFYTETARIRSILPKKKIMLANGSILHKLLGVESCLVNALHHQAIDKPGKGIRVSARETNGVVQAIELSGYRFVLGVQWHPEYLPQIGRQRNLFRQLVEHCGESASKKD